MHFHTPKYIDILLNLILNILLHCLSPKYHKRKSKIHKYYELLEINFECSVFHTFLNQPANQIQANCTVTENLVAMVIMYIFSNSLFLARFTLIKQRASFDNEMIVSVSWRNMKGKMFTWFLMQILTSKLF